MSSSTARRSTARSGRPEARPAGRATALSRLAARRRPAPFAHTVLAMVLMSRTAHLGPFVRPGRLDGALAGARWLLLIFSI